MLDILFVGGDKKDISNLKELPLNVDQVQNGMIALSALNTEYYDGVIIHDNLPLLTPDRLITEIREIDKFIPIFTIIISDQRKSNILKDLEQGATFYFEPESQDPDQLLELILMGKQYYDFIAELSELDRRFYRHNGSIGIIGVSEPMISLYRLLSQIRKKDVTTILYGESGTGKNLVSRSLHNNSLRTNNPFVSVNCPAIPKELLESELFGHKKGSFTGADSDKEGKFQAANSGTIFLDEIGDMDSGLQAKILRVLESGEVEKIGENESIKVNVRVISATNQDLPKMVEENKFRQDLFHRINVFPITIPSLSDHPGDIPLIAYTILGQLKKKHGLDIKFISSEALVFMKSYDWPGNVRELENVMERAILTSIDDQLTLQDLMPMIDQVPTSNVEQKVDREPQDIELNISKPHKKDLAIQGVEESNEKSSVSDLNKVELKSLKEIEIEAIKNTLLSTKYNMSKASKILGISRMTLYRKIEAYGLDENE